MTNQECCQWRELVEKALSKQNSGSEYYDALATWLELGGEEITFNCSPCDSFYSQIENKVQTFIQQEGFEGVKRKIGCCASISMIYDVFGKPKMTQYAYWLATFKDIMCSECNDKAKQVAIDTGLSKSIQQSLAREKQARLDKNYQEWWQNTPEREKALEIVYFEYLQEGRENPTHSLEIRIKMGQAGITNWLNPSLSELKEFLLKEVLEKLERGEYERTIEKSNE